MSNRFASLKEEATARVTPAKAKPVQEMAKAEPISVPGSSLAKARIGKKPIGGYFSPDMWRALHQLVLDGEAPSIQALVGEGLDLLLRSKGKHPFGER